MVHHAWPAQHEASKALRAAEVDAAAAAGGGAIDSVRCHRRRIARCWLLIDGLPTACTAGTLGKIEQCATSPRKALSHCSCSAVATLRIIRTRQRSARPRAIVPAGNVTAARRKWHRRPMDVGGARRPKHDTIDRAQRSGLYSGVKSPLSHQFRRIQLAAARTTHTDDRFVDITSSTRHLASRMPLARRRDACEMSQRSPPHATA